MILPAMDVCTEKTCKEWLALPPPLTATRGQTANNNYYDFHS